MECAMNDAAIKGTNVESFSKLDSVNYDKVDLLSNDIYCPTPGLLNRFADNAISYLGDGNRKNLGVFLIAVGGPLLLAGFLGAAPCVPIGLALLGAGWSLCLINTAITTHAYVKDARFTAMEVGVHIGVSLLRPLAASIGSLFFEFFYHLLHDTSPLPPPPYHAMPDDVVNWFATKIKSLDINQDESVLKMKTHQELLDLYLSLMKNKLIDCEINQKSKEIEELQSEIKGLKEQQNFIQNGKNLI
jgi:hypothetical protein